jgi:hypothetical protein
MGLRPTSEDENWLLFSNLSPRKRCPPFVISTGAQRSGEISVWTPLLGNVFRRTYPRNLGFIFPQTRSGAFSVARIAAVGSTGTNSPSRM